MGSSNRSAGVLTVSDGCARGRREDLGGRRVAEILRQGGWKVAERRVVPDEVRDIREAVLEWADEKALALVVATGGTGLGPRDVTPEALGPLLDKELPGLAELMRAEGLKSTPLAALSRQVAGSRGGTLVLAVPGSPRGAEESLRAVIGLLGHAAAILGGGGHG